MSDEQSASGVPSIGELRWHCRRAKLELDFVLEHYLDQHFRESSIEEQRDFVALLRADDQDIFDWVVHGVTPPSQGFAVIIEKMRDF